VAIPGGAEVRVVTATPPDWARVRALRLAALADAPDAFWATLAEEAHQPERWWRARLEDPARTTLLAVLDGRDVGLAGVGPHHDEPTDAGLYSVWVDPSARGRGLVGLLVTAAADVARRRGHRRLRLDVGDHNAAAQRAYRRAGFLPTGRAARFPPPRAHITEHELALDL
jgi:ribosomal protein S18 acetylase RimI-like enzyme